jgi:hypothetical protein
VLSARHAGRPRALAGAENSIERWWQQLEAAKKHPEGSFKVVNALAMAASYDSDPTQFLGIRLPVTFDTCKIIEERLRPQVYAAAERAWHRASLRGVSRQP